MDSILGDKAIWINFDKLENYFFTDELIGKINNEYATRVETILFPENKHGRMSTTGKLLGKSSVDS